MFDTIQLLLWTFTYVLIIISDYKSFKARKVAMPYIAGALNLAWEISATIISRGFWGHICWLSLDIIIYIFAVISLLKLYKYKCFLYIISTALLTVMFLFVLKVDGGMLISGFMLDIFMAVEYIVNHKSLSTVLIFPIALTKMFADLFAFISCMKYSLFVIIIGISVLLANLFFCCICLEKMEKKTKKRK